MGNSPGSGYESDYPQGVISLLTDTCDSIILAANGNRKLCIWLFDAEEEWKRMQIPGISDGVKELPSPLRLIVGDVVITPDVRDGQVQSLGAIEVCGIPLRNPATRMLPWLDTFNGDIFDHFYLREISETDAGVRIVTRTVANMDYPFRERRDCSGDLCFRETSWDASPREAQLCICFAPVATTIDALSFTGFKYWFEYESAELPIHRLLDRQTWEVGGNLNDITICLRNWLTAPRVRITRDEEYSTVGLDRWAKMLPGNLWARWSLLPAFDMQYGQAGVLLGWFDEVSLIRTVVETRCNEEALRYMDLHLFPQSGTVCTNPKTILWSPAVLDDIDALNLWTRISDCEQEKACRQFNIPPEEPPAVIFAENVWQGIRFDSSYEEMLAVAGEFAADYMFIDSIWEHEMAYHEALTALLPPDQQADPIFTKHRLISMCGTLDFNVANILGGEAGLTTLCDRARAKGIKVLSWMATHMSNATNLQCSNPELGHGINSIFAARESGRHPDTGYAADCWTLNLNAPVREYLTKQLIGVCERTGLGGYLWDSVSNLGWWPVDYSDGSMRPQFDHQGRLYGDLVRAGLYLLPEAIATFSAHSCCGLHGGNIYANEDLGYSYKTHINLWFGEEDMNTNYQNEILCGRAPIDMLFQCMAHLRVPTFAFHRVPRETWNDASVAEIKRLFAVYQRVRGRMLRRIVLHDMRGVLWENGTDTTLFYCFKDDVIPPAGSVYDLTADIVPTDGLFRANHVYELSGVVLAP